MRRTTAADASSPSGGAGATVCRRASDGPVTHRVLLIDDDAALVRLVADYLGGAGFAVESRGDGASGLLALRRAGAGGRPFDGVVLDLMLPDGDGLEVCRRLRADPDPGLAALPIVMLTARGDEADRIVGLELGADDYLGKPFHPRELLARLRAVLRRGSRPPAGAATLLRFGRLEIDRAARVARVDGEPRALTAHQFDLLVALAESAGRVLSRDALMSRLRGRELEAFDRSIDVHVSRIRAAIEDDPAHPRRILTVRGVGYVLAARQDDAS
jgi:two-component system, OmpR family, phosphate regulon response regulator OmpR